MQPETFPTQKQIEKTLRADPDLTRRKMDEYERRAEEEETRRRQEQEKVKEKSSSGWFRFLSGATAKVPEDLLTDDDSRGQPTPESMFTDETDDTEYTDYLSQLDFTVGDEVEYVARLKAQEMARAAEKAKERETREKEVAASQVDSGRRTSFAAHASGTESDTSPQVLHTGSGTPVYPDDREDSGDNINDEMTRRFELMMEFIHRELARTDEKSATSLVETEKRVASNFNGLSERMTRIEEQNARFDERATRTSRDVIEIRELLRSLADKGTKAGATSLVVSPQISVTDTTADTTRILVPEKKLTLTVPVKTTSGPAVGTNGSSPSRTTGLKLPVDATRVRSSSDPGANKEQNVFRVDHMDPLKRLKYMAIAKDNMPKFGGESHEDFDMFEKALYTKLGLYAVRDEDLITVLEGCFPSDTSAGMWFQNYKYSRELENRNSPLVLNEFLGKLKKKFSENSVSQEERAKEIKQRKHESASDYVDRKALALRKVGIVDKGTVVTYLLKGVHESYAPHMRSMSTFITSSSCLLRCTGRNKCVVTTDPNDARTGILP